MLLDKALIDKVQDLLNLGIGDVGRLEHIKNTLEQDLQLYISDRNYLDNLIKTHLPDSNISNLEPEKIKKVGFENSDQQNNPDKTESNTVKPKQYRVSSTRNHVRPRGVTVIAILKIISGIIGIFVGVIAGIVGFYAYENGGNPFVGILDGAILAAMAVVLVPFGMVSFVMAWGLLKGKSWAWTITLILTIVGLIFDVPSLNIIGIIIGAIILYYLYRPYVKAYFGK